MSNKYLIALDQGTTSSRAVLFDQNQQIVVMSQREFTQYYPMPGWVEHDPMEIWTSQQSVLMDVVHALGDHADEIAGIGITNQRETTILWEKDTGRPIYQAIVWQCRRTADLCEKLLEDKELTDYIKENTGLLVDAYFSGTKIKWILDNIPEAREKAEAGELLFGTVDTWLIWNLTGGQVHITDHTNASRTMLYNIKELRWDEKICSALGIPMSMLPEVRSSSEIYGYANLEGHRIPIAGCAGDQQAALFGQACFEKGDAKNTYGTGCFLLMNTGSEMVLSKNGLVTTLAASAGGKIQYVLEGSVFVGGAVVQWLRDELHLVQDSRDTEYFATRVPDNGGVYVVPAFTGLGAPYWDMYARGAILGLTRGANNKHIIRAALESIAYQTHDILEAMSQDIGAPLKELRVDGGASANNFLMQFQSDINHQVILRPVVRETTALGAAYLAGLAVGVWKNQDEIRRQWTLDRRFEPSMEQSQREVLLKGWKKAVSRAKEWED